ncbi:MAG: hypothetical protein ACXVAX_11680 [Pseudobdellovibrio sp.]
MLESIIQKKHKDRYRILFCHENFYSDYQSLFKMWKTRFAHLSDVEKLQAWTLCLSCLRRPQDWFGGKSQAPLVAENHFKNSLTLQELFENSPILIPKKINPTMNVFEFINNYKVKALPEACFRSLCYMVDNRYPLKMTQGEVTPFELLKIQLNGERVVALNEDYETWPHTLYANRDFLGFILHDLIHADHFFREPKHRNGQIGFYHFIRNFSETSSLQSLLEAHEFRSGFEYIISDMNSHPLHLFQTLHSLLFKTLRDDRLAEQIWKEWSNKTPTTELNLQILLKVNSPEFTHESARCLELLCETLSGITSPVTT